MCGRYTLTVSASVLGEVFEADVRVEHSPRYNIAPTQTVPIVRLDESGQRRVDGARWGLVPHWAKDPSIGNRMINARSETAADKPAFRSAIRRRRCLIPADGFFEWHRVAGGKQPYHIRFRDRRVTAFAGLWERWRASDDAPTLDSCTILTTSPTATVARIHDRMPVILPPDAWTVWMSREELPVQTLRGLFTAGPDDDLEAVAVSTRVNSPANDDPDVLTTGA
jgi:putative SOS response-associated peptidase YedK